MAVSVSGSGPHAPAGSTRPAAAASSGSSLGPPSELSNSVPPAATIAQQLSSAGVQVVIDGEDVPTFALSGRVLGFEENAAITARATHAATPDFRTALPSSPLKHAVAVEVLENLLWQDAGTSGQVESLDAARAVAQQDYQAYLADPGGLTLPTGMTAQDYFLGSNQLLLLQKVLTVQAEKTKIAGSQSAAGTVGGSPCSVLPTTGGTETCGSASPMAGSSDRTPALAQWLRTALTRHHVIVGGIAGLSASGLPDALPGGL